MKRRIAIAALTWLIPPTARADARISFRFDFIKTNVKGAYNGIVFDWQGLEFEFDKECRPSKLLLTGFSLGVRRELFYTFTHFVRNSRHHARSNGRDQIRRRIRLHARLSHQKHRHDEIDHRGSRPCGECRAFLSRSVVA